MNRRIESFTIVAGSIVCMIPSAWINAVHQLERTPGAAAYPLALASVLSVVVAGLSALAVEGMLLRRSYGKCFVAASVFLVCAAYNLSSAVGAASTARSDITGPRQSNNAKVKLLGGQIATAEKSRSALAVTSEEQTYGVIENALTAMRNDPKWSRSKGCADATLKDSREFCADYAKKQAQREAAVGVAELDSQISSLKAQLLSAGGADNGQVDPQADNIAQALAVVGVPTTVGGVGTGLNLWFAMTIEVLGSVGPTIVGWSIRASGRQPAPTPVKHMGDPVVAPQSEDMPQGGPAQDEPVAQADGPKVAHSRTRARKSGPKMGGPGPERTSGPGVAQGGPGWPTPSVNNVITVGPPMLERVAQMVAQGQSEREIAKCLGVGRTTVQRLKKESAARATNNAAEMARNEA